MQNSPKMERGAESSKGGILGLIGSSTSYRGGILGLIKGMIRMPVPPFNAFKKDPIGLLDEHGSPQYYECYLNKDHKRCSINTHRSMYVDQTGEGRWFDHRSIIDDIQDILKRNGIETTKTGFYNLIISEETYMFLLLRMVNNFTIIDQVKIKYNET